MLQVFLLMFQTSSNLFQNLFSFCSRAPFITDLPLLLLLEYSFSLFYYIRRPPRTPHSPSFPYVLFLFQIPHPPFRGFPILLQTFSFFFSISPPSPLTDSIILLNLSSHFSCLRPPPPPVPDFLYLSFVLLFLLFQISSSFSSNPTGFAIADPLISSPSPTTSPVKVLLIPSVLLDPPYLLLSLSLLLWTKYIPTTRKTRLNNNVHTSYNQRSYIHNYLLQKNFE